MTNHADLTGRTVLITGIATGIGLATARRFAQAGARLALGDIAADAGEALAAELRGKGTDARFLKTDVRRTAEVEALAALAHEAWGGVDAVFANAGIEGTFGPALGIAEADLQNLVEINLIGVWRTLRAVVPGMVERGRGSAIATASVGGLVGAGGLGPYVATKHAVVGLVKSLAIEVARSGVRVNAVCPGVIDTPMLTRLEAADASLGPALKAANPTGRHGLAAEVAEAVLWLASDAASFTNGHTLTVDGGYVAQ